MQFHETLRGIITVLNTPFTETGEIDTTGMERNVGYALEAGVSGFLVPAMAGEVGVLSDEERATVVSTVLNGVKGRVPVIGGASADTLEDRLFWTQKLVHLGCDGVLVSIPYASNDQYEREVREIAAAEPPFLMLQDWSSDGPGIPVSLVTRLFETIPCFKCLKIEVQDSGPKYTGVLAATGGRLHVSGGWAVTQMIDGLDRGVHAFLPTGLHRTYVRIYALYRQGRRNEAEALFERLRPVLAYSNQDLSCSIHFFKQLLWRQGVYVTPRIRQPLAHPVDTSRCEVMLSLAQDIENSCSVTLDTPETL